MMKSEDTASFLFGLAKRGRKYYLGIATITQDVVGIVALLASLQEAVATISREVAVCFAAVSWGGVAVVALLA